MASDERPNPRKEKNDDQTDLYQLKKLAHLFLMFEPERTEHSPIVLKHPFTECGICVVGKCKGEWKSANILEDREALQKWRELMSESIDNAENAGHIYMALTKSYKFAFLKHAVPYLSRKDLSEYLADAWVLCEAPNSDPNFTKRQMVSLFQKADPKTIMDADEYERLTDLEDVVTVYRGVTSFNAKQIKVLSWTLDRETANWFARRFGEDGTVYEAQIEKAHILALFNSRNENEVIVDPSYLTNITESFDVELEQSFQQTMQEVKPCSLKQPSAIPGIPNTALPIFHSRYRKTNTKAQWR